MDRMCIVVIEWDGKKAPSTWYNRLNALKVKVHKPKSVGGHEVLNPEQRRAFESTEEVYTGGTIVQEGCIITSSDSFARLIAGLAKNEFNAKSVHIGHVEMEKFNPEYDDAQIVNRVQSLLGQRGRPMNGERMTFTVTCLECGRVNVLEDQRFVIGCPSCLSVSVKHRLGTTIRMAVPNNGTIFEKWLSHRFWTGEFEPNYIDDDGPQPPPPTPSDFYIKTESEVVGKMTKIKWLSNLDNGITDGTVGIGTAFSILDSVFISRAYTSDVKRTDQRSRLLYALFSSGWEASELSILESSIPDVGDVTAFGHTRAIAFASVIRTLMKRS